MDVLPDFDCSRPANKLRNTLKTLIYSRFSPEIRGSLWNLSPMRDNPGPRREGFHVVKTRLFEITRQFAHRGTPADMRRTACRRNGQPGLEDTPAVLAFKVCVVTEKPPVRFENTVCLAHVTVAVPFLKVHENHRAIDRIDGIVRDRLQVMAADLDQLHVGVFLRPSRRMPEHGWRHVAPNPLANKRRQTPPYPANATSNLQKNILTSNPDGLAEQIECNLCGLLQAFFIRITGNVQERTFLGI